MKRRIAQLPLHGGKAPPWLFRRMVKLAGGITMAIVDEFGAEEMLRRLSDPWWFQAFGCVLGFDWHSSGVTTVTCGALKEAGKLFGDDMGIHIAGGKGGVSRKTPSEIAATADRISLNTGDELIHASRMSAKVDSAAVQDGFTLYHHCFLFTQDGNWCVVQQGMSDELGAARRYHWLSEGVEDFVCEPHHAVEDLSTARAESPTLNMVAHEADANRSACTQLVHEDPTHILEEVKAITDGPTLFAPNRHRVQSVDINPKRLRQLVIDAYEQQPDDYAALLGLSGMGPSAVRSLALIAEIIFEAPTSRRDPTEAESSHRKWADYSYAHGGKDKTPFPVDCETYDRNIDVLSNAIQQARVGDNEKFQALRRLNQARPA